MATEQVEDALEDVLEPGEDVQAAIHDCRKRCKKIRGLVRLVRPTRRSAVTGWTRRVAAVLAAVLLVVSGCDDSAQDEDAVDTAQATADLPAWLEAVEPRPGASVGPDNRVAIRYPRTEPPREIRLEIDGVDVTAVADLNQDALENTDLTQTVGELVYMPDRLEVGAPVVLEPGEHSVRAVLVRTEFGEQSVELDDFSWTFEIL